MTWVPWSADADRSVLHLGASYSFQARSSYTLRYRRRPETHIGDRWVDTKKFEVEHTHAWGLEAAGRLGAFSFQSELLYSGVDRSAADDVAFWGGYAQASFFLTGEGRPYSRRQGVFGRVYPRQKFDWSAGRWGAWEVGRALLVPRPRPRGPPRSPCSQGRWVMSPITDKDLTMEPVAP